MAPQVASLSELSRIRGDAEVRYPYARTEPELSAPGLDKRPREDGMGGGGRQMRSWEGGREGRREGGRGHIFFFSRNRELGGEREGERHKREGESQAAAR